MWILDKLKEKGLIDTECKKSPAPLPQDKRRCRKCGNEEMQAVGAFYGGWSHQETVFDYQCPNCGKMITLETHRGVHGGILLFFLLVELIFFFFADSPNFTGYGLWAAFFISLFLGFNADDWFLYPVMKKQSLKGILNK